MKKNPRKRQIVEAAARTIAEKGYESSSIKEIAAEAGLPAPGLIHYYFKTKEEILREVVKQSRERYEKEFGDTMPGRSSELFGAEEGAPRKTSEEHGPEWYKLRYEFFAQGLRDATLAGDVSRLLEVGRGGIAGVLDSALLGLGDQERESLSAILLACFDGLALQKLLYPELDLEKTYALLETMILDRFPAAE